MRRIRDHVDEDLLFVQPSLLRPRYELRSGETIIGELAFRNVFSSAARAESEEGSWIFRRSGLLHKRTSIGISGQEDEIASFVANAWFHSGTLYLPSGTTYDLSPNFWLTKFEIATNEGALLVSYSRIRWLLFRRSAAIRILPVAAALPELPWLVFLGWYTVVLATRDRRASAGGAS